MAKELGLEREQVKGIEAKSLRLLRSKLVKREHSEEYLNANKEIAGFGV